MEVNITKRIVMYLLALSAEQRDLSLSIATRDQVLENITTRAALTSAQTIVATANQLRALLAQEETGTTGLTNSEQQLLSEWLSRLTVQGR